MIILLGLVIHTLINCKCHLLLLPFTIFCHSKFCNPTLQWHTIFIMRYYNIYWIQRHCTNNAIIYNVKVVEIQLDWCGSLILSSIEHHFPFTSDIFYPSLSIFYSSSGISSPMKKLYLLDSPPCSAFRIRASRSYRYNYDRTSLIGKFVWSQITEHFFSE